MNVPSTKNGARILILGAGPCGLGAASTLQRSGFSNWHLYDAGEDAGGLASSIQSAEGFLFDIGGHTIFSHYKHFDDMCQRVCRHWSEYNRATYICMRGRFIPYPLQRNFGQLPPDEVEECLKGLLASAAPGRKPRNFEDWLRQQFGDGLYRIFMEPYNYKVWACHPSAMTSQWVNERVAPIDAANLQAIAQGKADTTWGPNAAFRYPTYGGVGAIWKGLAAELNSARLAFNKRAVRIDAGSNSVYFDDNTTDWYDYLITTIPLDRLCAMMRGSAAPLHKAAKKFVHSSTHIIGLGMNGTCPEHLKQADWLYFPESSTPFYRATIPSNYSSHVVAQPGQQWSLMLEVSESPVKAVGEDVVGETIAAARAVGLIAPDTSIVSTLHRRFEYGYPTPFIGRDQLLKYVQPVLQKHNVYSRGRFGGWKYEVSNHDHTYAQGVEVARHLLFGESEVTYFQPELINRGCVQSQPPTAPPQNS